MTESNTLPDAQTALEANAILSAEYSYIADTAAQANSDRSTVTSFYLTSIASLATVFLGFQAGIARLTMYKALALFLLGLTLLGITTLLQLMRLRTAWHESVVALNRLKDYYITHFADLPKAGLHLNIEEAFEWRASTIPSHYKTFSFSWLLALQVIGLGSATCGGGVFFLLVGMGWLGIDHQLAFAISLAAGLIFGAGSFLFYRYRMVAADAKTLRTLPPQSNAETDQTHP